MILLLSSSSECHKASSDLQVMQYLHNTAASESWSAYPLHGLRNISENVATSRILYCLQKVPQGGHADHPSSCQRYLWIEAKWHYHAEPSLTMNA